MKAISIRCTEATARLIGAKAPSDLNAAEIARLVMLVQATDTLALYAMPMSQRLLNEITR